MKIIIEMPDYKLWQLKNEPIKANFNIYELASYIDKGTPLIEADKAESEGVNEQVSTS